MNCQGFEDWSAILCRFSVVASDFVTLWLERWELFWRKRQNVCSSTALHCTLRAGNRTNQPQGKSRECGDREGCSALGFGHGRNESDERKYLRIRTWFWAISITWIKSYQSYEWYEWWSKDRDISWYFIENLTQHPNPKRLGTRCACHQRHCLLSRSSRSSSQTVRKFPRVHKQDGDVEEHAKDI